MTKYYKSYKKRGRAIIFNHYFHRTEEVRLGADIDEKNLETILNILKFDVKIYRDCSVQKIKSILESVSKEDHTDNECLLVIIMTHGKENILFDSTYEYYEHEILYEYFDGENCPSLIGKPKLFFIEACRGKKYESAVFANGYHSDATPINIPEIYVSRKPTIPNKSDILLVFSSFQGYASIRQESHGSWFIQALCEELRESWYKDDLISILTATNYRIHSYECPNKEGTQIFKQILCITTMLTRKYYFKPPETIQAKVRKLLINCYNWFCNLFFHNNY